MPEIAQIGFDILASLAYGVVSLILMVLGVWLVDLLTPGKLVDLIWRERKVAPVIHVASAILAVALIIRQAILSSADQLVPGLISTAVYGVIGLILMAIAFFVIDAITPGKLGELLTSEGMHPAVWVTAASQISVGLIMAAAIS
ncbi:DUF350 domain-containing protein [Enemella evansiae]|uniref:DUF350 domain-containing protein n=1 Tax=Enemella evansiae TaxID=2016499 RepID=A0A255GIT1_9ACTN|nr:DUF350 domain-containing protein [Enemella evansiae]PFG65496.1 uncharacterized membrane protein YjfL (UPF0719 family) [Propionibacteriaceae bacterium ES.041]OYN96267.1 hypothetical protein CGZ96_13465 [Enemella evansiae]OYO01783.1 hypothetical protein CGZ97_15265 [Enemella evansiae]OYO06791.1 hypothetical protein CGZ95_00475 [Enemella evansiae]OYO11040.1 hypothetical protein CGZ98_10495 [Enemella evansiae]